MKTFSGQKWAGIYSLMHSLGICIEREQLKTVTLSLYSTSRAELLARLSRLPSQIEAEDIPDLVTLAQV